MDNQTNKLSLRKELSALLGMAIPPKGFLQKFIELDSKGKFNNREILRILAILSQRVEDLENEQGTTL